MRSLRDIAAATTVLFCLTGIPSIVLAVVTHPPLQLKRVLWGTGGRWFVPTQQDFSGDGVQDLLIQTNTGASIISGTNGAVLRQYSPPPGASSSFGRLGTLPDADGDGKREVVVGNNTDVWAIRSSAGGGRVDQLSQVFAVNSLPFGGGIATSNQTVFIASGDYRSLRLVSSASGQTQARIANTTSINSIGGSAVNVGDLNGDGVDDFASAGANTSHFPYAGLFLINGAVTTSGPTDVLLQNLPAGAVLGELTGLDQIGSATAGNWHNTTVNLGDPYPNNGVTEFLLISGAPWGNNQAGGIAAHLVTRNPDGSLTTSLVTTYTPSPAHQYHLGGELVDIGDVTGDGVHDLAALSDGSPWNLIQIYNGAGLLDGIDPSIDVIQTIGGSTSALFYGSMYGLGDYDGDGQAELAVSVLYNGEDNFFGVSQQIYSIVPEPSTAIFFSMLFLAIQPRNRRRNIVP